MDINARRNGDRTPGQWCEPERKDSTVKEHRDSKEDSEYHCALVPRTAFRTYGATGVFVSMTATAPAVGSL